MEMSVAGKQTSSKKWNKPMLNGRKHMQDKDNRGDFTFRYGVIKMKMIYERLYLARIETRSGYMAHKNEEGNWHKDQYGKRTHEMKLQLDINGSPYGKWPF